MSDEDRVPADVTDAEPDVTESDVTESDVTDADADVTADDGADDLDTDPTGDTAVHSRGRARVWVSVALLAAMLIASAGVASWLYVKQYRPDQQTNPAAAKVALDAATSGTIALLSYAPDSLDKDFAAAKARLTGDFLSYYTQFTEQIVTPAAKQKSVKTTASVVRAAVSNIHPDTAEVLVFINQTTTSKENPDGAFAASSVKVGLKKINGSWLIDSFDPV